MLRSRREFSPFYPTGFYIPPGSTLNLNVEVTNGTARPRIYIGTLNRANNIIVDRLLNVGENNIYSESGGLLWVVYEEANNPISEAKITFNSGFKEATYFVKNKTTRTEWEQRWANLADVNEILLIGESTVLVIPKYGLHDNVYTQNNNVILRNTDYIKKKVDQIAGFDGSGVIHTVHPAPHLMVSNYSPTYSGNRASANNRRTTYGSISPQIFSENPRPNRAIPTTGHEMGHMQQQDDWTWDDVSHVTQEIFGRYADKSWHNEDIATELIYHPSLARVYAFLEDDSPEKNWSDFKGERFTMFLQLLLRPTGVDDFIKFHRLIRETYSGWNGYSTNSHEQKKQIFMINMSIATGEDLSTFFKKWGFFPEGHEVYDAIASLNLPPPNLEPHLFPFNIKQNVILEDGSFYEIEPQAKATSVLTVNNEQNIVLSARDSNNVNNQKFKAIKLDDDSYVFQSKSFPDKVIDVSDLGSQIFLSPFQEGKLSQRFKLYQWMSPNYINIKSLFTKDEEAYLDLQSNRTHDGNAILVYSNNNTEAQNFKIKKVE